MCHRKYNYKQYGILPNECMYLFCNGFEVFYFLVPLRIAGGGEVWLWYGYLTDVVLHSSKN